MMNLSILFALLLVQWVFRISVRWYFLASGLLLGIIPLLLRWGNNENGIVTADVVAQAVFFVFGAAIILSVFSVKKKNEPSLSQGTLEWIMQHTPLIIVGYGASVVLNYFLPTLSSLIFVIVVGGLIYGIRKEIFIYLTVLCIIGMLIVRGVVHEVSLADRIGIWSFYSIVAWTACLIRDLYIRKRSS